MKNALERPRLNLGHLLLLPKNKRNMYVGMTYFAGLEQVYNDCDAVEFLICGDYEDGYAEEESLLEYVLDYSGISIGEILDDEEPYLPNRIELIQNGKVYSVDYIMSEAGVSEECEHFNFNTLKFERECEAVSNEEVEDKEDQMRQVLVSLLSQYDTSLSTINASQLLDQVAANAEKALGITHKELQEMPY